MLSSSRLVSLLRTPCRIEHISNRVLIHVNTSRFLCIEPSWCRSSSDPTNNNVFRRPGVLNQATLERNCSLGLNSQYLRNFSQKVSEGKKSDSNPDATKSKPDEDADDLEQFQKLSLYEKIKAMYRDYWYVLVPVHLSTSVLFFGIFYYAASSGVDITSILETLHFSESVVNKLKDSSAGYFAIAYALYKIFTPVRYTVTLGGTTWAIRFLRARGMIKPRRPMKEAKENMQNIISAMKLPEQERQKFLAEKGMPRIGKAVSSLSNKANKEK